MLSHNGQALAYIGDAVYELYVREYHLNQGTTQVHALHDKTTKYTNAQGQYEALKVIEPHLSEKELSIVKRGRNASSARKPGQASQHIYRLSTGFEALIGYLYLNEEKSRLKTLLEMIF